MTADVLGSLFVSSQLCSTCYYVHSACAFRCDCVMQEQGYQYTLDWCHDDQPTWMKTRSESRILSIPYSQEINDIPSVIARHDTGAGFADMIIDQFDEMVEQTWSTKRVEKPGARGFEEGPVGPPLVLGIALHPYIVGQPFRLRHLKRALKHIAETHKKFIPYAYGDPWGGYPCEGRQHKVWITTPGQIAEHVMGLNPEADCLDVEGAGVGAENLPGGKFFEAKKSDQHGPATSPAEAM